MVITLVHSNRSGNIKVVAVSAHSIVCMYSVCVYDWSMYVLYFVTPTLKSVTVLSFWLAGDDVKEKKPDPSIYLTASNVILTITLSITWIHITIRTVKWYTLQKLGVSPRDCLVVEDSIIGLQVDLVICNNQLLLTLHA